MVIISLLPLIFGKEFFGEILGEVIVFFGKGLSFFRHIPLTRKRVFSECFISDVERAKGESTLSHFRAEELI